MKAESTAHGAAELSARTAMERSGLYGLLAAVFRREPTAALLRELARPELSTALGQAGLKLEEVAPGRPDDESIEDLAVEYARLFLGPGKHIPPYEGVYVENSLATATADEIARFIESHGFAYRPEYHDLPDHVSVELEFMAALAGEEAAAWERGEPAAASARSGIQAQFIAAHLLRWLPAFCADVVENAKLPFYREFANLLKGFIASEGQSIESGRPGDRA
jgi:DMSO reductase family type II enzyme chaperone